MRNRIKLGPGGKRQSFIIKGLCSPDSRVFNGKIFTLWVGLFAYYFFEIIVANSWTLNFTTLPRVGAWFTVLHIVSSMAVLTNGLLIAITAQFIPFQVYVRGGYSAEYIKSIENSSFGRDTKVHDLSGYIQWSTSPFALSRLLDGQAFPAYSAQALEMYDDSGNEVTNDNGESILYLPFIDFECLYEAVRYNVSTSAFFSNYSDPLTDRYVLGFTDAQYDCFYGHGSCSGTGADTGQFKQLVFDAKVDHSPRQPTGPCARLDGVHCQ